jgi:hypothetical protein
LSQSSGKIGQLAPAARSSHTSVHSNRSDPD